MATDKQVLHAVKLLTKHCISHGDCQGCVLLEFCESLGFYWTTPDKWDLSMLEVTDKDGI